MSFPSSPHVDLAPRATVPARREPDRIARVVQLLPDAVDPARIEGFVERDRVRDARQARPCAANLAVSNRRVLGTLGRWNRTNSPWIKAGLALAVIAMSFGLMVSM